MSEELDPGNFLGMSSWKGLHQMPGPAPALHQKQYQKQGWLLVQAEQAADYSRRAKRTRLPCYLASLRTAGVVADAK